MLIESSDWPSSEEVQQVIDKSPAGKNTKFLSAAHSLWTRFKNYDKAPPMALLINDRIVSLIFATYNTSGYTNLYEIVTVQGEEGNGYARALWKRYVFYAYYHKSMKRLKISCTPSSLSWHMKNGLIFWAVDKSGSLRSDQPLFPDIGEQLMFREKAVADPQQFLPPPNVITQFLKEGPDDHGFGPKKRQAVEEAIQMAGKYWLRPALFERPNLESFYET